MPLEDRDEVVCTETNLNISQLVFTPFQARGRFCRDKVGKMHVRTCSC